MLVLFSSLKQQGSLRCLKAPRSPSLSQLQRQASPEAPRVHLPSGEAAKLGGELLRGPLRHPDTSPAQNGNGGPPAGRN